MIFMTLMPDKSERPTPLRSNKIVSVLKDWDLASSSEANV